MGGPERTKLTLGQRLVSQRGRELINRGQACLMFINQVALDMIPAEVEALPPAFRRDLEEYIASLGIGTPEWEESFLLGGIYYFGERSAKWSRK
jgi:hypothetical protein